MSRPAVLHATEPADAAAHFGPPATPFHMRTKASVLATAAALALSIGSAEAQATFGSSCAGASGVTPSVGVSGVVTTGQLWTLEVSSPGGFGFGYLLIGFSNTSASVLGGLPLPLDLGTYFGDPLWSGCPLGVDPSYQILPYVFDPNANGGLWSASFPGFDTGSVFVQALNIDADFVTRIAGVSRGLEVKGSMDLAPGLIPIAPGTYSMGSLHELQQPMVDESDEAPVHLVTISAPFWIGQHEVTQAEYGALMGSNPSFFLGASRPVDSMSWDAARAYCAALTASESIAGRVPPGYEFRLPTEAEWEFACRAETQTEFAVGNGTELFCADAQIGYSLDSNSSCSPTGTAAVGSYAPNAWDLHDMHGNLYEWCLDSYSIYPSAPVADPFTSAGSPMVLRGGSYQTHSGKCRSAHRLFVPPHLGATDFGFRVVLAPNLAP